MALAQMANTAKDIIGSISAGWLAEGNARAQTTINEANAYASNLIRSSNNKVAAARSSLARYTQSVNNNRTLENTGKAVTQNNVNYRRSRDAAMSASLEDQIAQAEQQGAQAAAAAFSGLSGGVADVVRSTTALRASRIKQRKDQALTQMDSDQAARTGALLQAGWDNLDQTDIVANIDYGNDVPVQVQYTGGLFSEVMGGILKQEPKSLANQASWAKNKVRDWFADDTIPMQPGGGY
ncbi:MAG: hypothetical protein ING25_11015 [Burkholderiales bacterium]|nr:hypothetical protein [Burkholderiales bacterium]